VRVWPDLAPETLCIDSFRVRYMAGESFQVTHVEIAELLKKLADQKIDFVKTEQLYTFDDKPGYS
jgi:isocitrate dehydrogenase